jgi:response regulator of citrate/malate metabolism
VRPVDAYWLRKRLRGEVPAKLGDQAQAILDAHRIDPRHEPATHPALKGLPRGGLSYRIVEDLLDGRETTTAEIMQRYGITRTTVTNTMQFLHRSGRITAVRNEAGTTGFRKYVWMVTDTEALARGAEIAA